jgi:hypothetical protein
LAVNLLAAIFFTNHALVDFALLSDSYKLRFVCNQCVI